MKLKNLVVGGALAVAVAAGTVACSDAGYQSAYVVSRTMCGNQYCVVMSDGDVVTVNQSIWDSILYGMIIQSASNGGYHFVRSSSIRTRSITTVSYSKYRSVTRVSPSTEVSEESAGTTYNNGGSKYTSSPKYKASVAAAKSNSSSSYKSSTSKTGKTTYSGTKTTYSGTKSSYSGYKSSYSSSKKGY